MAVLASIATGIDPVSPIAEPNSAASAGLRYVGNENWICRN